MNPAHMKLSGPTSFPGGFTRLNCVLFLFVLGFLRGGAAPVAPSDNTAAPYMGLYAWGLGGGVSISHLANTATWLNRSSLWAEDFLDYSSWTNLEGPGWALSPASSWLEQNPGASYILTVGMLPSSGGTSLATGATGAYNSYYTTLAQNLVADGLANNTIIRLGHEFNGTWYAWKVTTDADALNFAAYWQQIVTAMRAVPGAANLKFCWNGCTGWSSFPVADAYPGDAYVDYIGVDVYDQSWATNTYPYPSDDSAADMLTRQQNAWVSYSTTNNYGLAWWHNFAVTHSKPLSIPEWGLCNRTDTHGGLDNPYYIQQMYNFIQDPVNNVAFHVYFDVNASDGAHQLTQLWGGTASQFVNGALLFRQLFGVPPLPVNADIGTVGLAGSSDPVTVNGAGTGYLTAASDNFHYAARTITGDDMLIAKITSLSAAATGQGGIMFRQSTDANAPYAALFIANGQCLFQSRLSAGGAAVQNFTINSVAAPVWLKMLRSGNLITGYESTDGLNWNYAGSQTLTLNSPAYIGLAVSSGSASTLNAVGVDDVDRPDIDANTPGVTSAIIVDSAATTGLTKIGSWTTSSTNTTAYGGTLLTAWAPATASSLTFSPTLPAAGPYEVYVRRLASYQDGDHTNVSITSSAGTVSGTINEQIDDQLWNYLGAYQFDAGTAGNLQINNTTPGGYGYVSVDAVMFVPLPVPGLPAPNLDLDIGGPTPAGSAAYSNGVYTLKAGGSDIYYNSDQFNYMYQSVTGDQALVARVTGLTNTNADAKVGLMFRDSTAANARFAMLNVKPGGGLEVITRTTGGGSAAYIIGAVTGITPSASTPIWIKLVKSGTDYTASYATTTTTPTTWTAIGTVSLSLTNTTYVAGLATVSHVNGTLTTATVDNYSLGLATAPGSVGAITQGTTTATTMAVSWNPVAGATSYDVGFQSSAGGDWVSYPTTATSYAFTGLTSATWYWVQVRAKNSAGAGPWTSVSSFETN